MPVIKANILEVMRVLQTFSQKTYLEVSQDSNDELNIISESRVLGRFEFDSIDKVAKIKRLEYRTNGIRITVEMEGLI